MIYPENILICIAAPIAVMLFFIRGREKLIPLFFLTGMLCCLLSAYISGFASYITGNERETVAVYLSPMIEECLKMVPLILFLGFFQLGDNMLILSAVAGGAGFATFENCCYILSSGAENLPYILVRGFAVGVMHVVSILLLAFALIFARRMRALTFSGVAGGLTLSMTFHGLYNLLVSQPGVSSAIGFILPAATAVILLILYHRLQFSKQKE